MHTVADLIDDAALAELATPATLRMGHEIADTGNIRFADFTPQKVIAHVVGPTTLQANADGLSWTCTCTSNHSHMCKHAVAVALATRHKNPPIRP